MITSHSLVIVIPLSLASLSLVYDIPPGQFSALRPDYYQGELQMRRELQIRFQIKKISGHPEGKMLQRRQISFIWKVWKQG